MRFTQIPACGDGATHLQGTVTGLPNPEAYRIAPYIYTGSWWTKPTFAQPTTGLVSAGGDSATFSVDVMTSPYDLEAGYIVAFLVPAAVAPPQAEDLPSLPQALFAYPHTEATRECGTRVLSAFGRAWWVKDSGGSQWGPGPNNFGGGPDNVWVDAQGRIHLRITQAGGLWYAAEVVDVTADPAVSSPGFGAYTFRVLGDLDALDKNVVLGLFTWDTYAPEYNYREIDFEASRWGNAADPTNCQFVVQPWNTPGNLVRFTVAAGETTTTQTFTWSADSVSFASWSGFGPRPQSVTYAYAYGGADVPPQGSTTANTRCNLWLINGTPPSNGQEVEMVIAGFTQGDPAVPVGIPGPAAGRVLSLGLSANPSRGQVRIGVEGPDGGPVTLEIVDARGRRVWSTVVTADHGQPLWAGRDTEGRAVAPGIYFVRATRGANQATIRLTRLP